MTKSPTKRATGAGKAAPRAKAPATKSTKTAAAKPSVNAATQPKVVASTQPVVTAPMMRKKELIDLVVAQSGIKKKDAKPVVEAMLSVLGQAVSEGRELNLQPLGKLKINRTKDVNNGQVLVCRLRRSAASKVETAAAKAAAPTDVADTIAKVSEPS